MKRTSTMLLTFAAVILLGATSARAAVLASNITGQSQNEPDTGTPQSLIASVARDNTATDTLYVKWTVFAYANYETENYWNGLTLTDNANADFRLGVGNNWWSGAYSTFGSPEIDLNTANPTGTNSYQLVETNDVTTFVVRIDYNAAAEDDVTIYLDPYLGTTELGQDTNLMTTFSADMSFDGIYTDGGRTNVGWYYTNAIVADDALDIFAADADDDSDGLPNTWELAYGLDPNDNGSINVDNGASGDPDSDGSFNIDEYNNETFPNDPDSDDDDLNDGDEATEGTDPLNPDCDGDYLSDGDEVITYTTDPLNPDSDTDGVNDGTEVSCGSDPKSVVSQPANDNPNLIGADFFDYADSYIWGQNGGEFFDMDNNISNDIYLGHTCAKDAWYDAGSSALVVNQRLITASSSQGFRNFNGAATGGEDVGIFSSDPTTGSSTSDLYIKVDATINNDSYAGISLYNGSSERLFFGKTFNSGTWGIDGADMNWVAWETLTGPAPDVTYTLVAKIDIVNRTALFWIDPNMGAGESGNFAQVGPAILNGVTDVNYTGIRLESGNSEGVRWDNLVLAYTWDALTYTGEDSEPDGLRDAWEKVWTNDLAVLTSGADFDSDGLDDDVEQEVSTDPTSADTDNDGLDDGDEVNTHSTDPADADSDDDGLSDGDEVNVHGTNPVKADSDDDGYSDLVELTAGTLPLDPNNNSSTITNIVLDGVLENTVYGEPVATQTVNTAWTDNRNELNAAYVHVEDNKLYMLITGNVEANYHKVEIFFDTNDSVTTNILDTTDGDNGVNMDGLVFDAGFEPDIHCYFRRGEGDAHFDIIKLAAQTNSYYGLFPGEGSATTGTGAANSEPMEIAYNDSNTGGVIDGTEAAPPAHWTNSLFGLEMCIDLVDLGVPSGTVKCAVMINNADRNYLSNQVLSGLLAGTDSLGGDMIGGGGDGTLSGIDFNLAPGNQFFEFAAQYKASDPAISSIKVVSGGTQVELELSDLVVGAYYVIEESGALEIPFTEVIGSGLIASNTTEIITVPTSLGDEQFFKAVAP